jgi:hypothetical protein
MADGRGYGGAVPRGNTVFSAFVAYRKPWARSWRRPLRSAPALALAGALAAVLPVASCTPAPAGSGAEGSASATGSASPAITAAQARQVWEHYVATAAKAVSPRLAAPELALVTGAERAVLSATLASRAVVVDETSNGAYSSSLSVTPGLSVYTYGAPAFYLPEAAGYPRFFVVSVARKLSGTKPTDNTSTTVGGATMPLDGGTLMLFTQARARAPWLLASTSQLSAGVAPPRLAADRAGYVPTVPLSDASLLAQPDDAGALQAAVVDDGQASAAAQAVADGPLTTGMYQGAVSHAGGLTAPPGDDYQWQLDGSSRRRGARVLRDVARHDGRRPRRDQQGQPDPLRTADSGPGQRPSAAPQGPGRSPSSTPVSADVVVRGR